MKMKKFLLIGVVLALMLTLILPSVAMAARPVTFQATGQMTGIDSGNVKPLGDSGLWLVKDRHIDGYFTEGFPTGQTFRITYGGVFKIATQAGSLAGTMKTGTNNYTITGKVAPLDMVDMGGDIYLPRLSISGHWTGTKGVNRSGTFTASVIFIPDAAGHVVAIPNSSFVMTGK
jgi:hypothetical protein